MRLVSTVSVPPRWLAGEASAAVQTEPSDTASALGLLSISIARLRRVVGSMRHTVPLPLSATHTAPSPNAIALGSCPTAMTSVTESVAGSMRETVASWRFATHAAPAPTATPTGRCPTPIVAAMSPDRGSIR